MAVFNFDPAKYDIFEGMTSISSVIDSILLGCSDRKILKVLYNRDKKKSKYNELKFLEHKSIELGFSMDDVSHTEIDALAQVKTHGGIVAVCTKKTPVQLSVDNIKKDGFYAVLEGLEDPYNYGYAIRSLYAAGADGIIISEDRFNNAKGLVCKASAGTSELIDSYISNTEDALDIFKTIGYKIACASIRDSVSIYDADLKKPILLIVGGEKRGISRTVLEKADMTVRIDYGKTFKGSLPAMSATTVIAFEIYRQNNT